MKKLVEDEELKSLRAMAEGAKPFERSGLWDKLSALDWLEIKKRFEALKDSAAGEREGAA